MRCLRCRAESQQFLCNNCISRTRATLLALPRLLRHLEEAAVGQTRLGDIGRRIPYRSRHELNGAAELASQIEPLPPCDEHGGPCDEPDAEAADLYESRRARDESVLRKLLAAGGVNERASTLHAHTINTLTTWMHDIAELHNLHERTVHEGFIGPLLPGWQRRNTDMLGPADTCKWLADHINHLANHKAADELCDELDTRTRQILRIINRPIPLRYVGPCPEPVDQPHDQDCEKRHPHVCDTALRAPHRATTVACTQCHTEHNIEELGAALLAGAGDDYWLNRTDLLFIMAARGTPVSERTFRQWRRDQRIEERFISDEPRYRIADAVKLLETKPQTRPTGGQAHRN